MGGNFILSLVFIKVGKSIQLMGQLDRRARIQDFGQEHFEVSQCLEKGAQTDHLEEEKVFGTDLLDLTVVFLQPHFCNLYHFSYALRLN